MSECLFCKIINGEIPSTKVYEDDKILAFKDINPLAPVHVLIIPKIHLDSVHDVKEEHIQLIGYLNSKIGEIAEMLDVDKDGYRVVTNKGDFGGQIVKHLHYHLLGGRKMQNELG